MQSWSRLPTSLGSLIPPEPHSTCVSLPTWSDVHGIALEDPKVLGQLKMTYPRMWIHESIVKVRLLCVLCISQDIYGSEFLRDKWTDASNLQLPSSPPSSNKNTPTLPPNAPSSSPPPTSPPSLTHGSTPTPLPPLQPTPPL